MSIDDIHCSDKLILRGETNYGKFRQFAGTPEVQKLFCKLKRMVDATQRFYSSSPATPAMQPYSHFLLDASPMDKGEENVEC